MANNIKIGDRVLHILSNQYATVTRTYTDSYMRQEIVILFDGASVPMNTRYCFVELVD